MLRFDDVILARPVRLEGEVKDRESMESACKKLDTLPIYWGLKHGDVDSKGGIDHAIGRARHLRYDLKRDAVVGDVVLDAIPEEIARRGTIGWSTWYHTAQQDDGLLKGIMWKHILATPTPLDEALETPLNMGYMVGESKELPVSPPASPTDDAVITVSQDTPTVDNMPDETPKEPKVTKAKAETLSTASPKSQSPSTPPPPPPDYTEARKELIQEYRDKLKGKLPDAALNSLTLKNLRATYQEIKVAEDKAREPEHPPQTREGLPGSASPDAPDLVELSTTKGSYVTIPGFVEALQEKHVKANPQNKSPFTPLTGPVSSYSNVAPVDAAEKKRLAEQSRSK